MKPGQIMKRQFCRLALSMATAITIFTGCQSPEEKTASAKSNVEEAKADLKEVKNDANAEAQASVNIDEWKAFRSKSEEKINSNKIRIAELKVKLKKPGEMLDPYYEKRIKTLEAKNEELKAKMDAYETNHSNWANFNREFNHDMDELERSLKDFTVDNKK
jgi:chromosome segregation ATPase